MHSSRGDIYDGLGDIFRRAAAEPRLQPLMSLSSVGGQYTGWASLTLLSMFAIMFLPRQFQIAVVENVDERHLRKASGSFRSYLVAINVFVLPIAFGGLLLFPEGRIDADTFVLALPLHEGQLALAMFAFVGGLSAATAMVIVETIALSTMICNDLVMPLLLRLGLLRSAGARDLSGMLLGIRRGAIVLVLLLGYLYFRLAGEAYALVSIGLISFAAVAQFAPVMLGGMYWRNGTRDGALAGLVAGFPGMGATRCCCRRSRNPAGCRSNSWSRACSASRSRGRRRCSDSPGSTRSRIACSGACSPTSAVTSAFRCSRGQARVKRRRACASSKRSRGAAAVPAVLARQRVAR